jgi:rubredoxin
LSTPEAHPFIPCPQCGYSLQGHEGDPVRCPECGWSGERKNLFVPVEEYRKALASLAALPGLCVFAEAVIAFCVAGVAQSGNTSKRPSSMAIPLGLGLLSLTALIWCVRHFRRSCEYRRGWIACLVWNQIRFGLIVGFLLVGWNVTIWVVFLNLTQSRAITWLVSILWFALFTIAARRVGAERAVGRRTRFFLHNAAAAAAWRAITKKEHS